MKRIFLLLLVVLVACAPKSPQLEMKESMPETVVETSEEVVSAPKELPPQSEAVQTNEMSGEESAYIEPYTDLGCENLLTADEFARECNQTVSALVVTHKVGTKNCFVSVKDRANERLTAGITLTGYADAERASTEFERRLKVFNVGADKSVGDRAYEFPKVDRETINFLKREFIVEVGSDTRLCSKDGLKEVAKMIANRLK